MGVVLYPGPCPSHIGRVRVVLERVDASGHLLYFRCSSLSRPGFAHIVTVYICHPGMFRSQLAHRAGVRSLLCGGHIKVHSTDEAYHYFGPAYNLTLLGVALEPEYRPVVRACYNALCSHTLGAVLTAMSVSSLESKGVKFFSSLSSDGIVLHWNELLQEYVPF